MHVTVTENGEDTEGVSELFCSTNPVPSGVAKKYQYAYRGGNSGAMLIIRDIDDGVSWHTAKCE